MSNDTNQRRVTMTAHRTRTNRPAYFDEYRAAFDLTPAQRRAQTVINRALAVLPPLGVDAAVPVGRRDWRDGTDEGWGE